MRFWNGFLRAGLLTAVFICGCSRESSEDHAKTTEREWNPKPPVTASTAAESVVDRPFQSILKLGDRFPLRKRVEQELVQDSLSGPAQRIFSELDVNFVISVLDRVDDRTKIRVNYDRIRYTQRIGDEQITFDSQNLPEELTPTLQAFHNMSRSGFDCWLDKNQQLVAVDGFEQFVKSILTGIAADKQPDVVLEVEAAAGDSGLADFIGESIGLLPQEPRYRPGDKWERSHSLTRPIPMHSLNVYTLKSVEQDLAVVDIRGKVTPSTTPVATDEESGVRVTVTGGETSGTCEIFTETGLPKISETEQLINMVVTVENALQFNQRKKIRTRIETFPPAPSATPIRIGQSNPLLEATSRFAHSN